MAKILVGVTGSVAALRTPALFAALREIGHDVRVVATSAALYFFDPTEVGPSHPTGGPLYQDEDEWAGESYLRGDPVLHIAFRDWADLLLVAPLDANTLGKFALGLSDNFLTCLFRAWDFRRPILLAPAMNTRMWDSPVTLRHLRTLLQDHGDGGPEAPWTLEDSPEIFARHAPTIGLIAPICKPLACGDVGLGGMAEVPALVEAVGQALEARSSLNP
ncbi:hypothetical protein BH23PLA1_BH23PLA1_10290 [soil metagenome]